MPARTQIPKVGADDTDAVGADTTATVGARGVVAQQPVADPVPDVKIVGKVEYAHPSHSDVYIQGMSHV
jgi:hypothetical protein